VANPTAYGVDIASFQGIPDWAKVKQHGFTFAYIKTTEYPHYVNPAATEQRVTAFKAGLTVGNYCYGKAKLGHGIEQADFFLKKSNIEAWHLIPFLDLEESGSEGAKPAELEQFAMDWGQHVCAALKISKVLLYTDQNMLRNRIKVTRRLQRLYVLDLADWTLGPPPKLRGWNIVCQQYDTSRGVPGIVGPVDKDRLYVPIDSLKIEHNRTGDIPLAEHSPTNPPSIARFWKARDE
jgi:GH25 family lysozyme M1 (1,4-beta-N-acetylmuramidase)